MERKKTIRGILYAISGGILWGISGTVGQYLFTHKGLNSQWITTVRMLMAGILLIGFVGLKTPKELLPV